MKGTFGKTEALHIRRLLARSSRQSFPDAASLIRFHEVLMFLRAFPQTPEIKRQAEALLTAFGARVEALRRAGADPHWFRPPVGIKNLFLAEALKRAGLRCVGWTVRYGNWFGRVRVDGKPG